MVGSSSEKGAKWVEVLAAETRGHRQGVEEGGGVLGRRLISPAGEGGVWWREMEVVVRVCTVGLGKGLSVQ